MFFWSTVKKLLKPDPEKEKSKKSHDNREEFEEFMEEWEGEDEVLSDPAYEALFCYISYSHRMDDYYDDTDPGNSERSLFDDWDH